MTCQNKYDSEDSVAGFLANDLSSVCLLETPSNQLELQLVVAKVLVLLGGYLRAALANPENFPIGSRTSTKTPDQMIISTIESHYDGIAFGAPRCRGHASLYVLLKDKRNVDH